MARSDLILNLVRSKVISDDTLFKHSVEALIAEESSKQHHVFANQLKELLRGSSASPGSFSSSKSSPQSANVFQGKAPQKRLEDMVLSDSIVTVVEEFIEEQLKTDLLRSYGVEPRHKVLLHGPPGVGKTSLAETIAESLSVPFFVLSYDRLISSFLGETSSRLADAIDQIRAHRCVVFFDEFETLGKERADSSDVGEAKRVLSSLLLLLDSLPSHVVLVAATNHPELLDRASWRRFDTKIEMLVPTDIEIKRWLNLFEARVGQSFGRCAGVISDLFAGKSFSDLEEFCMSSLRRYLVRKPEITFLDSLKTDIDRYKAKNKKRVKSKRVRKVAGR